MENIKLTTTNGYQVEILPELNYGQFLEVQKIIQSKIALDPTTKKVDNLNGDVLFDANNKAIELLLVKLTDPTGNELPNPAQALKNLPISDGVEINDQIQKIWTDAMTPKKKEIE